MSGPCPDDFLMTCSTDGLSWWPLPVAVVVLVWAWRRGWPR